MNTVYTFLTGEVGYALGWTVVHSLWQGMLIALLLAGALIGLQKRSAQLRYVLSNLSLLLLLAASGATFFSYYQVEEKSQGSLGSGGRTLGAASSRMVDETFTLAHVAQEFEAYFEEHLPLILCIWILGVAFFALRLLGGIAYVQHLKHHKVAPLSPSWQQRLQQLATQLPLRRPVALMESALVKTPMAIGYLKPVVLLPIGAINGLSAEQVEAVLAHELAHIYRQDYFFNILQSLIEALYYFNPAVWWISANIRMERENCCDDIAVALCGNSLAYAKALVKIEEASQSNPRMAMALARKGKGRLLHRIKRILNQPQNKSHIMEKFTATALLLAAILFLSASASRPAEEVAGIDTLEPLPRMVFGQVQPLHLQETSLAHLARLDTLPPGKVDFHSHKNGKEVKARIRGQKIVKLEIDGQEIPQSEFENYEGMVEELLGSVPEPPRPPAPPAPPAAPVPPASPTLPSAPAPPTPPAAPAPPAPPSIFGHRDVDHITAKKQDDGSTAIIIEKMDGEKIELIVANEEDGHAVYLDGEELEDGETKVIIEEASPGLFRFRSSGDAPNVWFSAPGEDGKWQSLGLGEEGAEGATFRKLMEQQREERERLREEMRDAREQMRFQSSEERERLLNDLKAQQDRIREQSAEAMEQYREQLRQQREERKQLFEDGNFNFNTEGNFLFFSPEHSGIRGNKNSALEQQLLADGLIDTAANYKFEINGKGLLKVNGKKQPKATYEKYRQLWEEISGKKIQDKSNIQINKKSQAD